MTYEKYSDKSNPVCQRRNNKTSGAVSLHVSHRKLSVLSMDKRQCLWMSWFVLWIMQLHAASQRFAQNIFIFSRTLRPSSPKQRTSSSQLLSFSPLNLTCFHVARLTSREDLRIDLRYPHMRVKKKFRPTVRTSPGSGCHRFLGHAVLVYFQAKKHMCCFDHARCVVTGNIILACRQLFRCIKMWFSATNDCLSNCSCNTHCVDFSFLLQHISGNVFFFKKVKQIKNL